MGPNVKRWMEPNSAVFDDERVLKTMGEIEQLVGPSGARS